MSLDSAKLSDTHEMVMSLHSRLDAGDFARAAASAGAGALFGVPILPAVVIFGGGVLLGAALLGAFD